MTLESPLLSKTPGAWGELVAANLREFMSDHAFCEEQAAMSALSLIGYYPDDRELVERMTALASEELAHFRKVAALLYRRGWHPAPRRPTPWVRRLRAAMEPEREHLLKVDRLCVAALIEARSAERFERASEVVTDPDVSELLAELGPAEARHWRVFHRLAARELSPSDFQDRWQRWLERECETSRQFGLAPTVHG